MPHSFTLRSRMMKLSRCEFSSSENNIYGWNMWLESHAAFLLWFQLTIMSKRILCQRPIVPTEVITIKVMYCSKYHTPEIDKQINIQIPRFLEFLVCNIYHP